VAGVLVVVGGLAAVGLAVLAVAVRPVAQPPAEPAPPAQTSDLVRVIADHIHDQSAAARKYRDQVLTVTGTVRARDWHTRKAQGVLVTLDQVEGPHTVAATFKPPHTDAALTLPVGDRVTVRGRYSAGAVIPGAVALVLTDCEPAR
jgi:hypothetical protein